MATQTYGSSRQTFDHGICKTLNSFKLHFEGRGTIDDDPATVLYLKREDGSQGFYLPEQTVLGITGLAVISNYTDAYSTSTVEHIEFNGLVFRDASGNVTVVIDPATPQTEAQATISIVANTTVQAFEVKVEVVSTPDATVVMCSAELDVECIHEPTALGRMQSGSASVLAAAE